MKVDKFGNSAAGGTGENRHVTVVNTIEEDNFLSRVGPGLHFDAKSERIINLDHPANESDATTKQYVDQATKTRIYTFHYHRGAWLAAGYADLHRLTRGGEVYQIAIASDDPGQGLNAWVITENAALLVEKKAGEACSVRNMAENPTKFDVGHSFKVQADRRDPPVPNGNHVIDVYCRLD